MSAYQVNSDTIDLMVSVLVANDWQRVSGSPYVYTFGVAPTDNELVEQTEHRNGYQVTRADYTTADALGRELIAANIESLNARYSDGDTLCNYTAAGYVWRAVSTIQATPERAMGAVNCYRYQACEFDGWRGSFADELSQRCLDRLVDIVATGWDYERPTGGTVVSLFDMARGAD